MAGKESFNRTRQGTGQTKGLYIESPNTAGAPGICPSPWSPPGPAPATRLGDCPTVIPAQG